jgi:[ribosomal protein S18]-alanine N-acetyltransferase
MPNQPSEPLRQAEPSDVAVLAAIHQAAFPFEAWGSDVFALQLALPGVFGLIDATDGFILIRVVADEAEILTFAVVPWRQRHGLGRRLLQSGIEEAGMRGAQQLFLEVSVKNSAARKLYEGAAFVSVGLRPRYYADGSDALVLQRVIDIQKR